MAIEIVMPKLGWTMEEGILDEWIKQDGDEVQPGDIIFVVESDKALQEIEAFDGGILRISPDSPPVGATIKIGETLAYLVQPGEEPPFERAGAAQTSQPSAPTADPASKSAPTPKAQKTGQRAREDAPAISPRAKRVALELNVDWSGLSGSGSSGRIIERDIRAAAALHSRPAPAADIRITPVARRLALDAGIPLEELAALHPGVRVTRADVEAVLAERGSDALAERQPLSRIRQLTRDRMVESARQAAPVTLTTEADASELRQIRRKLAADGKDIVPSYNDLMVKLVAAALAAHPTLNASIEGDEILLHGAINIGIAVDSERGLLAPVIRGAHRLSLLELAAISADLIARTRAGTVTSDELGGGTFTITNLGMYDIEAFTPIINLPQSAILGVGRIVPRQIVLDADAERLAIRHMMSLSLTFDHRVVDGAPAARFLQRVKQLAETPYLWLVN
ncbi:MAG: dihydrolipoamide acetyltransferase family protein [Chloroflexi bacterium]|nr:dihydrolipoamide acetyltransferase family protein [Chloroflexota bacterium]